MKLLVFAHTPPPHHGQSYMVKIMLDGFGGDRRHRRNRLTHYDDFELQCYHVNARLSRDMEDIGSMRPQKFLILFWHCLNAIWCRYRYSIQTLYYIPAPGKHSAIWRDWLVMKLCRPFFDKLILHWHAAGMSTWLQTSVQMRTRKITYQSLGQASLSIVLSNHGRSDAEKLLPRQVSVVGNGIPDPCPDFITKVLPRRRARRAFRQFLLEGREPTPDLLAQAGSDPQILKVLFMAHCTAEKGIFEAVHGVILAHERLTSLNSPISIKLQVAGAFMNRGEEAEFHELCRTKGKQIVDYVGFVGGERKDQLLSESDVFCFPSHLESFGLVLAEAMAFGLPIITTRCGALQEVMSSSYTGLVDVNAANQIAATLERMIIEAPFETLRKRFEDHFTVERHLKNLATSLRSVEANRAPSTSRQAEEAAG